MTEFVTANGNIYECSKIETGIDSVTLKIIDQDEDSIKTLFKDVTEFTVSFGEKGKSLDGEIQLEEPHGTYENLKLKFVGEDIADGSVIVIMHIKSEIERRMDALEESQIIQNDAIAELSQTVGGEA